MNRTKSLLFLLLICLSLVACASESIEQDGKYGQLESTIRDGQITPENNFSNLDYASSWNNTKALVKIEAGGLKGDGVIWRIVEDKGNTDIYIVTAAHVIETDGAFITFNDGSRYRADYMVKNEKIDLALLRVELENNELLANLAEVKKEKTEANTNMTTDTVCYALEYDDFTSINVKLGLIIDSWIYVEDFGQYMIYASLRASFGMSGGALYDEEENVIGILCGMGDEGEIVAVPITVVEAFVMQNY